MELEWTCCKPGISVTRAKPQSPIQITASEREVGKEKMRKEETFNMHFQKFTISFLLLSFSPSVCVLYVCVVYVL